jgi:hypothetical protein
MMKNGQLSEPPRRLVLDVRIPAGGVKLAGDLSLPANGEAWWCLHTEAAAVAIAPGTAT